MSHSLKIIYMGTPEFAVPGLQILVQNGFNVVAVITAPDKPAGRGLQIQQSPVKQFAIERNIPVLQPEKLKNPEFIAQLISFPADLQVVVAFRMLPEIVWSMPPLGSLNLHASLLPDYRGAAPINWAIINGEKETGVTTFFLKHEIDTGDIILQEKIHIHSDDNAGTLHDKLKIAGAELLLKTVIAIENKTYSPVPQKNTSNKTAPKIFKEDRKIDWNKDLHYIKNFVRGLSPSPTAYTLLDNKIIKIFRVHIEENEHNESVGKFITDGSTFLKFIASKGYIYIEELQIEGKKRMFVQEFLRGYKK
ncbi:MAG: methionyl-tRNA formyltransferase [Fimbriimonadaceae bacterium]|nr:methionyl-tRNA formyltransferase [Chitinophagales bacterium]